jgi:hypothetical protein
MKPYRDQFEPFKSRFDLTFDGVGRSNKERKRHLYPYKIENVWFALSIEALRERVSIVDKAIVKCMKL